MKKFLCYLLITSILITSCVGCGKSKKDAVLKKQDKVTEHEHVYEETVIEASCGVEGKKTFTCTICEDTYSENIPALEHSYQVTNSSNATCTSSGSKTYTCSLCSHSYTETVNQTGHNWETATCYTAKKCRTCGITEGSALGHNDNGGTCSRCGEQLSLPLEYELAAHALNDAYNNAKFPSTLQIEKAYYTASDWTGNPRVVLVCSADNELGGKGSIYAQGRIWESQITTSTHSKNPLTSFDGYTQLNIQKCYDAYDFTF